MPVDFEIDHQTRLVHARAHGPVTLQELFDYFDAITLQEAAAYPKLFDAREMVPNVSDDEVMALGARVSAYAAFDPRGAVAVVVNSDEARDGVRRYMNLSGADRPVRMFTTVEAARTWLLAQRIND